MANDSMLIWLWRWQLSGVSARSIRGRREAGRFPFLRHRFCYRATLAPEEDEEDQSCHQRQVHHSAHSTASDCTCVILMNDRRRLYRTSGRW